MEMSAGARKNDHSKGQDVNTTRSSLSPCRWHVTPAGDTEPVTTSGRRLGGGQRGKNRRVGRGGGAQNARQDLREDL